MHKDADLFTHTSIDNRASKTLFLLHGTGGTENDFFFLDRLLDNKFNLLGLRGNIIEDDMNRFFRRLSEGVFDQETIKLESSKLKQFIQDWADKHSQSIEELYFLGYSNGANMLLATIFYHPEVIKNVLLLHPMLPFEPKRDSIELSGHTGFLSYGEKDQLISQSESENIITILNNLNMELKVMRYPSGHEISQEEINDIVAYLLP